MAPESRFLTLLKVMKDPISYRRKTCPEKCWLLLFPLVYKSKLLDAMITVPAGYRTDFASVPRWPLAFMLTGDTVHAAAVVHDWLIDSRSVKRSVADSIFLEAMKAEGVALWRRSIMAAAVRGYTTGLWLAGKQAKVSKKPKGITPLHGIPVAKIAKCSAFSVPGQAPQPKQPFAD